MVSSDLKHSNLGQENTMVTPMTGFENQGIYLALNRLSFPAYIL